MTADLFNSSAAKTDREMPLPFFAGFLRAGRNQLVGTRHLQLTLALVMRAAERINVPIRVGAVGFLNMRADQVHVQASADGTESHAPPAIPFPMLEPRTAQAFGL
jgi:hypothetical protein